MRLFLARIKDFIKAIVKFLAKDIWVLDFSQLSDVRKRWIKNAQAFILTAKGFARERIGREAIALSRFTTLAFIPMIAVVLFVSHGFGLDRALQDVLLKSFPTSTQLIQVITNYAMNIVKATESGTFGWISFLSFVSSRQPWAYGEKAYTALFSRASFAEDTLRMAPASWQMV